MGYPPGGPISGGMEAQQGFALETIQERQQQQGAERPEPVQRPQEASAPSQAEIEAAAVQKNLELNDRYSEQNAQERGAVQKALMEAVQALAPKENSVPDQQIEQQQQRGGPEM